MSFKAVENKFTNNFSTGLDLFLNNASRSPIPLSHKKIIEDYLVEWARAKHDPYYYNFNHADMLKQQIGRFVNCDTNKIAIGTNVADGFSNLINGLSWKDNDEVLLTHEDYPSVTLPFHTQQSPSIKWIKPINGIATIEAIQNVLTPQVKAIAISWVNYTTGQVNPIPAISKLCQKHNILLLVDATQALGVLPIDLSNVHIDYVTASLYKWCFCPQGTAISIFSNKLLNQVNPIGSGVFSQHDRQLRYSPNQPANSAQKFEFGNLNILGIMLAYETFKWFNEVSIHLIHSTLTNLTQEILKLLTEKCYKYPVKYNEEHESSIISFIHPNSEEFMKQLHSQGGSATYRHGLVRLSPGIYQTETTIKTLSTIL
ncbi:MAG: aminotransferase class V-fold PLP-dependent enzyme [Candidatus Margulisiibacteriota bacterium]|nr:aminotransferase class V-fold PLP-dependent enzyme [Candidatus Margulisiibacteriota bacterium]